MKTAAQPPQTCPPGHLGRNLRGTASLDLDAEPLELPSKGPLNPSHAGLCTLPLTLSSSLSAQTLWNPPTSLTSSRSRGAQTHPKQIHCRSPTQVPPSPSSTSACPVVQTRHLGVTVLLPLSPRTVTLSFLPLWSILKSSLLSARCPHPGPIIFPRCCSCLFTAFHPLLWPPQSLCPRIRWVF